MDILSIVSFVVFGACIFKLGRTLDKIKKDIIRIKERVGIKDE
jgi:hypothetical protein